MELIFEPIKNSLKVKILLKAGKKTIISKNARNCAEIPKILDRIFLASKIDKYQIKKVKIASLNEISGITINILKALVKTVNFLLFSNESK